MSHGTSAAEALGAVTAQLLVAYIASVREYTAVLVPVAVVGMHTWDPVSHLLLALVLCVLQM
jgi:hypothetical protein